MAFVYSALALAEVLVLFASVIGLIALAGVRIVRAIRRFGEETEAAGTKIQQPHMSGIDLRPVRVEHHRSRDRRYRP